MCGRFTLRTPAAEAARHFALFEVPELEPRYNIAPSQPVAAVRAAASGQRELVMLRWGLIPSWADDPALGNRLINARAEGVHQKPAFRQAFRRRRCLVPADGFYEWQRVGGQKQPYHIGLRDGSLFAFAGLWELWQRGEAAVDSCTLITTEANDALRPIHDRMPVILASADYDRWLDPDNQQADDLLPLLRPYASEPMVAKPVSRWVNVPTHEGPRCLELDVPDE